MTQEISDQWFIYCVIYQEVWAHWPLGGADLASGCAHLGREVTMAALGVKDNPFPFGAGAQSCSESQVGFQTRELAFTLREGKVIGTAVLE